MQKFLELRSHTPIWSFVIHQIKSFKMIGVILTLLIQVRSVGQGSRLWPNCFLTNCWFLLSAHSNCLPFDLINEVGFQCSVCLRKALPSAHLYQLRDSRDRTLIHIKATARRHLLTNSNSQSSQPCCEIRPTYLNFYFCHGPRNLRNVGNFIPSICDQECCQLLFCLFSVVFCRFL